MELLIVGAICASFFTAAALVYQNVSSNQNRYRTLGDVAIGGDINSNFSGGLATADVVRPYHAPNFGRGRFAMALRDELAADLEVASAVYCLDRDALNTVRPSEFALGATDGNDLDTSEKFREFIKTEFPDSALIYRPSRGANDGQGVTTYILQPSNDPTKLSVRSIYEMDLVETTAPAGVYASVRKYVGSTRTMYYDIFYSEADADDFGPMLAAFEKEDRAAVVEGGGHDKFKVAKDQPFYFMWWPDPAEPRLTAFGAPVYAGTDPRSEYNDAAYKTAYFYTIPMFPNL